MNKGNIKKAIELFKKSVNDDTAEINIMLVNQNNYRSKIYNGFMLKTKTEDIKPVILESLKYILEGLDKRSLDPYDLEISFDESIQMVNGDEVVHGIEILNEITVDYNESNIVSENIDFSKMKFMVIQIHVNEKSIYLFNKYVHPSSTYKTTQKYIFSGGVLKPFNKKLITLNSVVDAVLLDNTYYVYNRNSFNTIFIYKDVFERIINDNADNIKKCKFLKNTDCFISDCQSDGRYLKKLTKIIIAKGFDEAEQNKDEIPKVIEKFGLSLRTSEKGEVIYHNKEDLPELLNLLLRHYVIDALTNSKMIAAAIQKYQA